MSAQPMNITRAFPAALCLLLMAAQVPGGSGQIWNTDLGRQFYRDCGRVELQHPSGWPYWKQGGYPPQYSRRIDGGWKPHAGQFPPFYRISIGGWGLFGWFWSNTCGAVLIDEEHLLTAAHCVNGTVHRPGRVTATHEHYVDSGNTFSDRNVSAICLHRNYGLRNELNNDVALLKLDRPVELNEYIQPSCLPSEYPVDTAIHYLVGIGKDRSGDLQKITALPLLRKGDRYNNGCPSNNTNNIVCWGSSIKKLGVGCKGDSGSPVLRINDKDGRLTTYGIHSGGTTSVCEARMDKTHFAANLYRMLIDGDIQDMMDRCS